MGAENGWLTFAHCEHHALEVVDDAFFMIFLVTPLAQTSFTPAATQPLNVRRYSHQLQPAPLVC